MSPPAFALIATLGASVATNPGVASRRDVCADRDSIRALLPRPVIDEQLVVRLVPGGFGGITTTYMYLKQPALADSVRRIARVLAECPAHGRASLWALLQTVEVRQGKYDWIELQREFDTLLTVPWDGVVTGGIDGGNNRLHYGLASQAAIDAFRARAKSLGVPSEMLNLGIEHIDTLTPSRSRGRPSTATTTPPHRVTSNDGDWKGILG